MYDDSRISMSNLYREVDDEPQTIRCPHVRAASQPPVSLSELPTLPPPVQIVVPSTDDGSRP